MTARGARAAFRRTQNRHSKSGNPCHHFDYHGLTCDQYDALLSRAGGACELCRTPASDTGGRRLVVDHFESSHPGLRVIRGMLCDACNSALSCLDGTKRWGARRLAMEPLDRAYQARVLAGLSTGELAEIERIQAHRQRLIAA